MRCAAPRCGLLTAATVLAALTPRPGQATAGAIRLTAEPGFALLSMRPNGSRLRHRLGALGAASIAVRLTDLLWLRLHVDRKYFGRKSIPFPGQTRLNRRATVGGVTLVYNIDVLNVTPFVELGAARTTLTSPDRPGEYHGSETVPVLGFGADADVGGITTAGLVARYYPLRNSALLDRPLYTTLNARLSVLWHLPRHVR